MQRVFENSVTITCTHNDKKVNAEIDNFKFQESLNAFLATNKIHMKWNGQVHVGNAHGMEFTTLGPNEHIIKEGRR